MSSRSKEKKPNTLTHSERHEQKKIKEQSELARGTLAGERERESERENGRKKRQVIQKKQKERRKKLTCTIKKKK